MILAFSLAVGAAVIVLWAALNKALFRDPLSPFNLLLFAWVGPLFLRSLSLSSMMLPWSNRVLVLIIYTTVALALPCVISSRPADRALDAKLNLYMRQSARLLANNRFLWFLFLAYLVGFAAYIQNEFINNPVGIQLLAYIQDPSVSQDYHRFGKTSHLWYSYLTPLLYVINPMFYLAARMAQSTLRRWVLLILVLAYPFMCILKMSRIDAIDVIVSLIMVEYYLRRSGYLVKARARTPRRPYLKWVIVGIVLGVPGVIGMNRFQTLRMGGTIATYTIFRDLGFENLGSSPLATVLAEAYVYFSMPFDNFADYATSSNDGFNPGVGFFRPFLSVTGNGARADAMLDAIAFNPHIGAMNTYTFIALIYAESGVAGIFVVPLVYAGLVSAFYMKFRRKPNFRNLFLYISTSYAWLWLFAVNGFSVLTFYLQLGAIAAIGYVGYIIVGGVRARRVTPARIRRNALMARPYPGLMPADKKFFT